MRSNRKSQCASAHLAVTGTLAEFIIPPYFRQATAVLRCEKTILRWPGPFGSGFLSPQPPGAVGIGPVPQRSLSPYWANESWSFFFFGVGRHSGARQRVRAKRGPMTGSARTRKSTNLSDRDSGFALARPGMTKSEIQCSVVKAAPSIGPGRSRLPSWT
jgi:hypothetical protein